MLETKHYKSAMPAQAKGVLIDSHDTFGLGNIRRMVSIAEFLIAADAAKFCGRHYDKESDVLAESLL